MFNYGIIFKKYKQMDHLKKWGEMGCFVRTKPAQNTPHPTLLRRYKQMRVSDMLCIPETLIVELEKG